MPASFREWLHALHSIPEGDFVNWRECLKSAQFSSRFSLRCAPFLFLPLMREETLCSLPDFSYDLLPYSALGNFYSIRFCLATEFVSILKESVLNKSTDLIAGSGATTMGWDIYFC